MPANSRLLAVILGGGAGNRLFPLTQQRSKPAVPLGGKYRLVDIALSNCINSDILRTFVLTQYNSASLNRHIAQTYRFSQFSHGIGSSLKPLRAFGCLLGRDDLDEAV